MTVYGLQERKGIVTGGARRGGCSQAAARLLVNSGASVVLIDVDNAVHDVASELRSSLSARLAQGWVEATTGDLAVPGVAEQAVDVCVLKYGDVDFVVNIAGGSDPAVPTTCAETQPQHYEVLYRKNVITTRNMIMAAVPAMKAGGGRHDIINVSTTNGTPGWPWAGEPALAEAKAAVETMTRNWAAELKSSGICVNCIRPASIPNPHSPTWSARLADPRVLERMRQLYGEQGPLTAEQFAHEVAHLLDPAAPSRTGQIVTLDAGVGALGLEAPRTDGAWWIPAQVGESQGGNGRLFARRVLARLGTLLSSMLS